MKQPKADPQLSPPAAQARATIRPSEPAKQAPPVLAVVPPPAPPKVVTKMPEGAIVLLNPTIHLGEYLFISPTQQVKKLTPKTAWIAQGAIVIDEYELVIPLAGNYIRTTAT